MRLTRFTDYSLRVLIYLGLEQDRLVTIRSISDAYAISRNHLMKVVSLLTRMGYLNAQRGPGGGIRLARPPSEINWSSSRIRSGIGSAMNIRMARAPSPANRASNPSYIDQGAG